MNTSTTMMISGFETYKAKDGWRWRLRASNGRVIAESGEAYKKRITKSRVMKTLARALRDCEDDDWPELMGELRAIFCPKSHQS